MSFIGDELLHNPECPGCRTKVKGSLAEHFEHCMMYQLQRQLAVKNDRPKIDRSKAAVSQYGKLYGTPPRTHS